MSPRLTIAPLFITVENRYDKHFFGCRDPSAGCALWWMKIKAEQEESTVMTDDQELCYTSIICK